jgi:tRNA(Ile)-lysidine synthase TilS/MesJ
MIHITEEIPRKVAVAVSGGIDSMGALDFLRRSHEVVALHFNHGTPYAPDAEKHVRYYCDENNILLITEMQRGNACWCLQGSVVARTKIQIL